ncbi:MAG TPA: HNH endonuclease [Coriobacteriia bacterium]|nr:HNH endonuclease [Coriobacteriia bacterium]
MDTAAERAFREALMRSLVESAEAGDGTLARADLTHFHFADRDWRLVDESRGIRNPADLETTLSIIHNPDGPYADREISPGVWEYAYEKGSLEGSNTKLRRAHELALPVIFFLKLDTAVFVPVSLAFVIDDDRERRVFTVALEEVGLLADPLHPTELQRRYAERIVRQRMHQPAFRGLVLRAYALRCTVCSLHHGALLDAAHIVPDTEPAGIPTTPNGLALCKIHHAAYDQNMLGVSPDYRVSINREVLAEVDGPMLRHGLQEMHGRTITLPARRMDRPDRDLLAWRWERFTR